MATKVSRKVHLAGDPPAAEKRFTATVSVHRDGRTTRMDITDIHVILINGKVVGSVEATD